MDNDNFQYPPLIAEPVWVPIAKRVRAFRENKPVADSRRVMLRRVFPMVYYFPVDDVNMQLLGKSISQPESDSWGNRFFWHVKAGPTKAENAAWSYEEPSGEAPPGIGEYVAFKWEAMDLWLEEDDEVRVHPHDPYHRIDIRQSSRHVRVEHAGEVLAETHCPVLLFETGMPVRFYIRKTDIRPGVLKPADHHTECPYKGEASYYSVAKESENSENLGWTYPFPLIEAFAIRDMVSFYQEKAGAFYVDGEQWPRER